MKKNLKAELEKIVNEMIQSMEENPSGEWIKSWTVGNGLAKNFITKKSYRGFNSFYLPFIMNKRGYKAPYFLTFKQVKDKGGQVNKGAKSIPVFFYKMLNITDTFEDDKTGETVSQNKKIPMLREYKVFNIEDTNLDYELPNTEEVTNNFKDLIIDNFIEDTGANISYGGDKACFIPSLDVINMPELKQFNNSANFYSTLFHELTHWTGSAKRLKRDMGGSFGSESYAFEELIAELGSAFLCSYFGVDIETCQHPEYLNSWLKALKEKPSLLWKASSQSQAAFDYLIELSEKAEIEREAELNKVA